MAKNCLNLLEFKHLVVSLGNANTGRVDCFCSRNECLRHIVFLHEDEPTQFQGV